MRVTCSAARGPVDPGDEVHHRGLARAVRADQGVDPGAAAAPRGRCPSTARSPPNCMLRPSSRRRCAAAGAGRGEGALDRRPAPAARSLSSAPTRARPRGGPARHRPSHCSPAPTTPWGRPYIMATSRPPYTIKRSCSKRWSISGRRVRHSAPTTGPRRVPFPPKMMMRTKKIDCRNSKGVRADVGLVEGEQPAGEPGEGGAQDKAGQLCPVHRDPDGGRRHLALLDGLKAAAARRADPVSLEQRVPRRDTRDRERRTTARGARSRPRGASGWP